MSWETIFSADPRFTEFIRPIIEDEKDFPYGSVFQSNAEEKSEHYLLFSNESKAAKYLLGVNKPIKLLSSIDPAQQLEIVNILFDRFELENGALYDLWEKSLNPEHHRFRVSSLEICYRVLGGGRSEDIYNDFNELVFDFCIETKGEHHKGGYNSSYAIYVDKPFAECYLWIKQFEDTVKTFCSDVIFFNFLGICGDCEKSITISWKEYAAGIRDFFCYECHDKKTKELRIKEEERKKEKKRIDRLSKGLNIGAPLGKQTEPMPPVTLSPDQVLRSGKKLGLALYKIYHGRCQYCADPKPLPREEMHIEHIIPSSVPLDEVWRKLHAIGVSENQAKNFCAVLLPLKHDCVLNYTLSCAQHNNRKSGRILHPAALESLLRQAKQKAKNILKYIAEN